MYLIDTDVISAARKGKKANHGVRRFLTRTAAEGVATFLSVVTVGELQRGVDSIRHRGDELQVWVLDRWLQTVLADYRDRILPFDQECAQAWGRLRVPHAENALDKQIAATASIHGLTVVTRNERHFLSTGVKILNPLNKRCGTLWPLKRHAMKQHYRIKLCWDDEAHVWYVAESDVPGLSMEAPTQAAMLKKLKVLVPELLEENNVAVSSRDVPLELLYARREVIRLTG